MKKILIFGNSGSGKSTLATTLCRTEGLSHLDLDTLAWMPATPGKTESEKKAPPTRKPLVESRSAISDFIHSTPGWVIEGCYSDLLEIALPYSNEILFLNLPVELCIENARNHPWEPHKYISKEAQDDNLPMLIDWIAQYPERTDTFSKASHVRLYEQYTGKKSMVTSHTRSIRH